MWPRPFQGEPMRSSFRLRAVPSTTFNPLLCVLAGAGRAAFARAQRRRIPAMGSVALAALFAGLVLLAALPARGAGSGNLPPAFARSVLVADNLAPNPFGGFGVVLRIDPTNCNVIQTLYEPGGGGFTVNDTGDLVVE